MRNINEDNKILKSLQNTFTGMNIYNKLLEQDGAYVLRAELQGLGTQDGIAFLDVMVIPTREEEDGSLAYFLLVHTTMTRDFEEENFELALVALNNINQMSTVGSFLISLEEANIYHKYTMRLSNAATDEEIEDTVHLAVSEVMILISMMYDDILILSNDAEGFMKLIELEEKEALEEKDE